MLSRRERWGLSGRGLLTLLVALLSVSAFIFLRCYSFLALTRPVPAKVLVVEGWVHSYAAREAVEEFKRGAYEQVFSTGGPVVGTGGYINDFNTAASVGADVLKRAGLPASCLQPVPSKEMARNRTYSSAIALRDWLRQNDRHVQSLNIITEDLHARRSRLLYQKAFGKDTVIGVISVPNPDYDEKHWWRYSEAVREVVGESIGYLYARIFF
jgi:uncharacterized SAM-binding protein YcdF (DUF218 family)